MDTNDEISLVKNHRSRPLIGRTMFFTNEKWSYGKPRHPWRENWQAAFLFSRCRKGLWTSVQFNFIAEQENKATLQKTQRDVKRLQTFLGSRNDTGTATKTSSYEKANPAISPSTSESQ